MKFRNPIFLLCFLSITILHAQTDSTTKVENSVLEESVVETKAQYFEFAIVDSFQNLTETIIGRGERVTVYTSQGKTIGRLGNVKEGLIVVRGKEINVKDIWAVKVSQPFHKQALAVVLGVPAGIMLGVGIFWVSEGVWCTTSNWCDDSDGYMYFGIGAGFLAASGGIMYASKNLWAKKYKNQASYGFITVAQ